MIRVAGLSKRYGAVVALDGLSFDVERGETFALVGPNGAGKTTALKILLGLVRPDAGTIAVGPEGRSPRDPESRRSLGYVPQRVTFPAGRTAAEALAFFAALRGLGPDAVARALARVRMESFAGRRAHELSGGMTQRLSLAQALLGDPSILVLDEPTASLDPEATWEFRGLVEELRREGCTIVLCSHLLGEVERVADRVLVLVGGRRAALESLADLRARQASATRLVVRLRGDGPAAAAALATRGFTAEVAAPDRILVEGRNGTGAAALEALRDAGHGIAAFELERPTLEELFLRAVHGEEVPRG
jgi:ABC-type multidrug transport system ATPase subunit